MTASRTLVCLGLLAATALLAGCHHGSAGDPCKSNADCMAGLYCNTGSDLCVMPTSADSGGLGSDSGGAGTDATTPGVDSSAPGTDATAPGTDAAPTCAGSGDACVTDGPGPRCCETVVCCPNDPVGTAGVCAVQCG
jgi:hypothetical protein